MSNCLSRRKENFNNRIGTVRNRDRQGTLGGVPKLSINKSRYAELRLRVNLDDFIPLQTECSHHALLVGDEGVNSLLQGRRRG